MRFVILVKATQASEAGVMPSTEELTAMGNFNEQLVNAGIMLAGEGLHPTAKATRVRFAGSKPTTLDGPFTETKELVAGFWIWKVSSRDEAVDWAKRAPFSRGEELEIRQIFEAEDFGDAATPELREREERLRAQVEKG